MAVTTNPLTPSVSPFFKGMILIIIILVVILMTSSLSYANTSYDEIRARGACAHIGLNAMSWRYASSIDKQNNRLEITCGTVAYLPKRIMFASSEGMVLVRPAEPSYTADHLPNTTPSQSRAQE